MLGEQAGISEVVFYGGVYQGTLDVRAPAGVNAGGFHPLLLRAADGEQPHRLCSLSARQEARQVEGLAGVYWVDAALFRSKEARDGGVIPVYQPEK